MEKKSVDWPSFFSGLGMLAMWLMTVLALLFPRAAE
jgi:hypothetical protein